MGTDWKKATQTSKRIMAAGGLIATVHGTVAPLTPSKTPELTRHYTKTLTAQQKDLTKARASATRRDIERAIRGATYKAPSTSLTQPRQLKKLAKKYSKK